MACSPSAEREFSVGVNTAEVTASACNCRVCGAFQVGQSLLDVRQLGP